MNPKKKLSKDGVILHPSIGSGLKKVKFPFMTSAGLASVSFLGIRAVMPKLMRHSSRI